MTERRTHITTRYNAQQRQGRKLSSNDLHNSLQIMRSLTMVHMQRKHAVWNNMHREHNERIHVMHMHNDL